MSVPVPSFEALLAEVRRIDGFALGCVVDASTGMILASMREDPDMRLPVAAAGAADVANAISLMVAGLAADGDLEDVIVTLSGHYHLIRRFGPAPGLRLLLLVVLDRAHANLGMAHREIRDSVMGLVTGAAPGPQDPHPGGRGAEP